MGSNTDTRDEREGYTERELMVSASAREIEDGDTVFVGMRLPLIAFQLAVSTHAPRATAVFESGVIRDDPADGFLHTMCDLPNINHALSNTGMIDIMSRLQRGDIDVGFLGGAEIDRYGNLNTTWVKAGDRDIRLPGSGGACDIACMAERTVIVMPHEPRRFVKKVHYNTSPGHGTGGNWRSENGLPGGGPASLVTSKATFGFDNEGEIYLRTLHPGVELSDVTSHFSWDLKTVEDVENEEEKVTTTQQPTQNELSLIRGFDPEGFWTR
ncbi:MAG: CoA-transferase [Halobacteria archaeon]|nr:CoA-transferase [Halobacteria archaeon]